MKCLYCGEEIPEKTEDSKGRSHTKKAKFCRDKNCYRLWWNDKHKEYKRQQEKVRYRKKKAKKMSGPETHKEAVKIFKKAINEHNLKTEKGQK